MIKQDDFNLEMVNVPFPVGDAHRPPSYGIYSSQPFFARICSYVSDFSNRNQFLTANLLKQGYRYHEIRKAFSEFYHRYCELIVKNNIGLKLLLQQGILEPVFYSDLVFKFKELLKTPILEIISKR